MKDKDIKKSRSGKKGTTEMYKNKERYYDYNMADSFQKKLMKNIISVNLKMQINDLKLTQEEIINMYLIITLKK